MGEARSPKEFARRIKDAATSTERHIPEIVRNAAADAKRVFLETAAAKGMHQGGKLAGKRWGVNYTLMGHEHALVRYTGPFQLVESDTKAHPIDPKKKKGLAFDGGVFASANHPGTHGKHIFAAAKQIAAAEIPKKMAAELHKGWLEALK